MTFLIDGYNLMFALGYLSKRMSAKKFEKQRHAFLDWLARESTGRGATIRVVFDAQQAVTPSSESEHKGVRVLFAYRDTADDVIERLLAKEPQTASVTVVSNDTRVQDSAKHRGSAVNTIEDFTDWLIERRPAPQVPGAAPPEKPLAPESADEIEELLKEFSKPKKK